VRRDRPEISIPKKDSKNLIENERRKRKKFEQKSPSGSRSGGRGINYRSLWKSMATNWPKHITKSQKKTSNRFQAAPLALPEESFSHSYRAA
jgi:hypothetical protein